MANPAPGFEKNPDHTVTIEPADKSVEVQVGQTVIGSSAQALVLHEANYPPVYYLPMDAVAPDNLVASDHTTYCPFKGTASYFDLTIDGKVHSNAVWYYPDPYDEALQIKDHIAFYPSIAAVG